MDENKNTINTPDASILYINLRICNEVCYDTINRLKDTTMLDAYKNCKSVQNKIKKLDIILTKNIIDTETKNVIINDYILE